MFPIMAESHEKKLAWSVTIALWTSMFGLGAWGLAQIHTIKVELTTIKQIVVDGKEARLLAEAQNVLAHKQLLDKMDQLVPKAELELKLQNINLKIASIEKDIVVLKEKVR